MNTHAYVIPYTIASELVADQPKGHFVVTITDVCKIGLVGGKVEAGESIVDALCREMYEETGQRLNPRGLEVVGTYTVDENGWKTENYVYAYRCETHTLNVKHVENAGYIRVPITHPSQPRYLSKALGRFFQTFPISPHVRQWIQDFLIQNKLCGIAFFDNL